MNALLVRLAQSHDQHACMVLAAVLRKALVRRNEHTSLGLGQRPQLVIEHALSQSAANVQTSCPAARSASTVIFGMFSSTNIFTWRARPIQRRDLLFSKGCRVVKAC